MATPTPGKHAAVAATPPVSTPFSASQSHLAAFSPRGPRSVGPSPQQFKKSPANASTLYGHPTNSPFGGMNFDSPSAAAALGVLPALGDLTLDAHGAIVMAGSVDGTVRNDEDDKKKKLQQVIDMLKVNQGRVSEEGIERLARRVGLECLWEDQMGSGGTIRTLVVAGSGLSLEFDFTNNAVGKVSLSFPESPEIVTKHSNAAADILLRDLQLRPQESPLTKLLDKFAVNLERLAALDKLSVMPSLNCHEAIAGIYESLKRLHEWEVARLKDEEAMKGKPTEQVTRAALCSESGRPVMNARENVGLSLDYWQERHVRENSSKSKTSALGHDKEPRTWSLVIECAPSPALVYPSVRVTDKWISTDIQKANPTADDLIMETGGPILDWQEPENILLPADSTKVEGAMEGIEQDLNASNSKLPNVMFIAKFYPPLVVPYNVAQQIHSATGSTMDTHHHVNTLDNIIFPRKPDEKGEADASYRRIRKQSVVVVEEDGRKITKTHKNTLTFEKLEYGRALTELPFSHPRQLVDLLPLLRQHACFSSLVDKSFGSDTEEVKDDEKKTAAQSTIRDEFEDFMSEALTEAASLPHFDKLPVDISINTQPHPEFRVTFPFRRRTADIKFDVGMNATVTVASENILDDYDSEGSGKGKQLTKEDLGKMLEISEDLGIFVEFIRKRLQ
jgi:hypothetical protein